MFERVGYLQGEGGIDNASRELRIHGRIERRCDSGRGARASRVSADLVSAIDRALGPLSWAPRLTVLRPEAAHVR